LDRSATALVLFTRDLRVHDQPALAAAAGVANRVVPLFVLDDAILGSRFAAANRVAFLVEALRDLDGSLRRLGAGLLVRRGDVVEETMRVALEADAATIHVSEEVSRYGRARERRLGEACAEAGRELVVAPGVTAVPPGDLAPADGDHFRVFTPHWRRWKEAERRRRLPAPRRLELPEGLEPGGRPRLDDVDVRGASPGLPRGGENEARRRLAAWSRSGLARYPERSDDLAADGTSRLSPYLHFGCLSPLEVVDRLEGRGGAEPFLRQLCWRDFYHQLLAANPETPDRDLRPRRDRWRDDPEALAAWMEGRTGYPLVDAGMRQLADEGWLPNRARLVTASFLVKDLYLDWRAGAAHFFDLLVDGDLANNVGNWQWVAGVGVDTRPNRVFNPTAQAKRFDPDGEYVRRWVPELAELPGPAIHEPWKANGGLAPLDYPEPIVDHAEAVRRFRARRA
jgi:deoxyribodipyrimidine photo-lyase